MKIFKPKKSILILAVVILVGIPGVIYLVSQNSNSGKNNPDSIKGSEENTVFGNDLKEMVDKIGTLIELPSNELPNIATVTDVSRLKDQAFFAKAQNGDKVLLYTSAKWGIIYRPSTNKIIEATSVDVRLNEESPLATESGMTKDGLESTEPKILLEENQ